MDTTFTNASARKTTMTAHILRSAPLAALAASLLAACGQGPAKPAPEARTAGGAHEALTGEPVCAGPGVHDVHVALFRCDTCHPTGATFGFDLAYTFPSGLTSTGGGTFVRDASGVTCTVACHFPRGGAAHPVAWATPGPLACTACHATAGLPASHPAVEAGASRADCQLCHVMGDHMEGTVVVAGHGTDWSNRLSPSFHAYSANAGLETCKSCHGTTLAGGAGPACSTCHAAAGSAPPFDCTGCHGGTDDTSGAPPRTTWGNSGDAVRVGAHARHLVATAIAPAAECSSCHATPSDMFAAGHIDGGTAEVVFGRTIPGRTPAWDRAAATCTNSYCHSKAAGGARPAPVWTRLDQGEGACGACHALPPPAPHPAASGLASCVSCHSLSMRAPGEVIPPSEGGQHLNGSVEATGGHPASFTDPASPEFHAYAANRGLASCQGCHGPALDGVGGSTSVGCQSCHGAGFTSRCTGCHGGVADQTGAPPRTTWGGASDPLRVGAHAKHLAVGALAAPIQCSACHAVPADAFSAGHLGDPFAEVVFSGRATGPGASPAWDRATGTCSGVYCHGSYSGTYRYEVYDWGSETYVPMSFDYAGANAAPSWVGSAACGSCHARPPAGAWHSTYHGYNDTHRQCQVCHPDAAGLGADATITNPALHVNGTVDVTPAWTTTCTNCH